MARPVETDENHHRWSRAILAVVLVGLSAGALVYLWMPTRPETPERSVGKFCDQMRQLERLDESLADLDPTAVRDAIPSLERLQAVAPTEILQAVSVILDTSRSLIDPIKQAQVDEEMLTEAWRAKQPDLARVQSAGKALTTYVSDRCGMDLSPTTTTSKTATLAAPQTAPQAPQAAPQAPQTAPTTVAATALPTTASTPKTTAKVPTKAPTKAPTTTRVKAPANTTPATNPTTAAPRKPKSP